MLFVLPVAYADVVPNARGDKREARWKREGARDGDSNYFLSP